LNKLVFEEGEGCEVHP